MEQTETIMLTAGAEQTPANIARDNMEILTDDLIIRETPWEPVVEVCCDARDAGSRSQMPSGGVRMTNPYPNLDAMMDVQEGVKTHTDKQRRCFLLYVAGYTQWEIGGYFGIGQRRVCDRIETAIEKLEKYLTGGG